MGQFLQYIVSEALNLLSFFIVVWVIMGWLIAFNVINLRNPSVRQIWAFLDRVMMWLLAPLRRVIPAIAGIDLTPFIALILLRGVNAYLVPWIFDPIIRIIG